MPSDTRCCSRRSSASGSRAGARLLGAAVLTVAAAAIAAGAFCAPARAAEPAPSVKGKVLEICTGKYALCDAAACTPIPEQQGKPGSLPKTNPSHALCECVVEDGPNLGPGPCKDRVPQGKKGEYILSTYSFALKDHPYLSCPAGGERTVCFGYPCLIDESHPDRAHCTCPIKYASQAFLTQGGSCNVASCSTGLWQGGTAAEYKLINDKFGKATGQQPPPNCAAIVKP
jgi:hypothetical protein